MSIQLSGGSSRQRAGEGGGQRWCLSVNHLQLIYIYLLINIKILNKIDLGFG